MSSMVDTFNGRSVLGRWPRFLSNYGYANQCFLYSFCEMNERVTEQLDKILALADSNHEGEAAAAVRKARQMLSRDGLSFGDLAKAASSPSFFKSSVSASAFSTQRNLLESQIAHLRQQVEDMKAQMQTQDLQIDFWRRRAGELEQASVCAQTEAEKWKKLASETADRLWEMGRSMGGEDFSPKDAHDIPEAKSVAG